MKLTFEPNPHPGTTNILAHIDKDTYISFNPSPCKGMFGMEGDTNTGETAIHIEGEWLILNGDWRERYTQAFEKDGLSGVLTVYTENQENHGSTWSTGADVTEWLEKRLEQLR